MKKSKITEFCPILRLLFHEFAAKAVCASETIIGGALMSMLMDQDMQCEYDINSGDIVLAKAELNANTDPFFQPDYHPC